MDRRTFLSLCIKGGVSAAVLTSTQLSAMQSLLNQQQYHDYKALVCVFLLGGNDSMNMLLPMSGEEKANYLASRQQLAIVDPISLSPVSALPDTGLNPALAPLHELFNAGDLAFVGGVGTLSAPTTLDDYINKRSHIPSHLFSHNDQQARWMHGKEKQSINTGWGARMLELLEDQPHFASNISLAGTNPWQIGSKTSAFAMSRTGQANISAFSGTNTRAVQLEQSVMRQLAGSQKRMAKVYGDGLTQGIANSQAMNASLENVAPLPDFGSGRLSQQLQTVARVIASQSQQGAGRQIFYVTMGGFDTHDEQVTKHPELLAELATSFSELNKAMVSLGVSDQVTSFTMSDFGRTLSSNGDGTDHGWAGNQIVMGGAVKGRDIYGALLPQRLGSEFDVKGGRLIPQVSTDQYSATLAKWFGLSGSELNELFPSLSRFDQQTLNFMT
ncbi:DUF1501 domain-containing protein [Motilimonas sp. E26]|uniref:DUF1501 domain-containing protein n=1 Tax=Motilimonas sp. E26 TaxID=2865674 RepID=UPI001E3790A0|nr:DUF1501 domain-containing protein [Motilimonas sp. E26]MCE0555561.1 DUF1501 domain-containing protein [Motilimonas sp. E26]